MKKIIIASSFFLGIFAHAQQLWKFDDIHKIFGDVNTEAEESIPVFSKDSSALYFVRTFDKRNIGGINDQDIWVSFKQKDNSFKGQKNVEQLNNKFHNAIIGVSENGKTFYLLNAYDGKRDLIKGISKVSKNGDSWGKPEKIEIPNLDIDGDFYGFFMSKDENVLLISYKGPATFGEEDLYVSIKNASSWSEPINLGNTINTAGFEMSPFLSKNNDTLFFTSTGHEGYGDGDIFYAVKGSSWTNWSNPINLGPQINSEKFDAYFIYSGNQVFWSSNRDKEKSDIYTAFIIKPDPLEILCNLTNPSSPIAKDGVVGVQVSGGLEPYSYRWSTGEQSISIKNVNAGEWKVIVSDASGQSLEKSCVLEIPKNLITWENLKFKHNFNYNKNVLSAEKGELKEFLNKMETQISQGRESVKILIVSSASNVPTKTYKTNQNLANIRAENIKILLEKYVQQKGLSAKVQISIKSVLVDGPEYIKDSKNQSKYFPYQFVALEME
jgi:hypothetical protein